MKDIYVKHLEWDSGIFGFKIGRLNNIKAGENEKETRSLIKRIVDDCRLEHYRHITCRIGLGDFTLLRALEKNGFNIADIQITLSTGGRPKKKKFALRGITIRKASRRDLDQIRTLTKDSFTDTRIVRDPNYPPKKADEFYYEWVKNSVHNKKQVVFLAEEDRSKKLAGFVICEVSNGIGFIDLISVDKKMRRRGIGGILVGAAMNWFSRNSKEAEVRTQVSNTAAIRAFTRGGFKFLVPGRAVPSGISMHYWF